jgi:hypothetical protein
MMRYFPHIFTPNQRGRKTRSQRRRRLDKSSCGIHKLMGLGYVNRQAVSVSSFKWDPNTKKNEYSWM